MDDEWWRWMIIDDDGWRDDEEWWWWRDDDGDGWLWWMMMMLDDNNDDEWWLWMMMNNAMLPQPYHTTICSFYMTVSQWTFCGDIANFTATLQACCNEKTLLYGCKGLQFLKTLAALEGRTANIYISGFFSS